MEYSEITFTIDPCSDTIREILCAELTESGFEGFTETETGLTGYIKQGAFDTSVADNLIEKYRNDRLQISYDCKLLEHQNWNEEWEKNFKPVLIGNLCIVKAPFHENVPAAKYEILIEPKMSFGTGHHETTSLMIEGMLQVDFTGKTVLDMGCGTGILAILASKLGAKNILALDNDSWAYENTLENISLNNTPGIRVTNGTSASIGKEKFDVILANITKNIILADAGIYASALTEKGMLFCSGFYETDKKDIQTRAEGFGLSCISFKSRNNWTVLQFSKT